MPQYRKLHTKIVESLDLHEMADDTMRLAWCLLPLALDREGRGLDNPAWLKAKLFPLREDLDPAHLAHCLDHWHTAGMITRYRVGGRGYFCVPTWEAYQGDTSKEQPSSYPAPWLAEQDDPCACPPTTAPQSREALRPVAACPACAGAAGTGVGMHRERSGQDRPQDGTAEAQDGTAEAQNGRGCATGAGEAPASDGAARRAAPASPAGRPVIIACACATGAGEGDAARHPSPAPLQTRSGVTPDLLQTNSGPTPELLRTCSSLDADADPDPEASSAAAADDDANPVGRHPGRTQTDSEGTELITVLLNAGLDRKTAQSLRHIPPDDARAWIRAIEQRNGIINPRGLLVHVLKTGQPPPATTPRERTWQDLARSLEQYQ